MAYEIAILSYLHILSLIVKWRFSYVQTFKSVERFQNLPKIHIACDAINLYNPVNISLIANSRF